MHLPKVYKTAPQPSHRPLPHALTPLTCKSHGQWLCVPRKATPTPHVSPHPYPSSPPHAPTPLTCTFRGQSPAGSASSSILQHQDRSMQGTGLWQVTGEQGKCVQVTSEQGKGVQVTGQQATDNLLEHPRPSPDTPALADTKALVCTHHLAHEHGQPSTGTAVQLFFLLCATHAFTNDTIKPSTCCRSPTHRDACPALGFALLINSPPIQAGRVSP